MNVAIDIGNTRIKVGVFEKKRLWRYFDFDTLWQLQDWLKAQAHIQHLIVASVGQYGLENLYTAHVEGLKMQLSHESDLPIHITYRTPHTLGVDRIAAAAAAHTLFPARPVLVVDIGTCITYDLVKPTGEYPGGIISPGVRMRLRAMHAFTARLPRLEWSPAEELPALIGRSTTEAMKTGAVQGVLGEISFFAESFAKEYPNLQIILCGGDALFFKKQLKFHTFAEPKLVLIGLNRILDYNAEKHT
ncbi:type III pantothenate kinase [Thermonema rossianum]|uniref:type III pantothenate kinase n=1 Tax=Thermonema rossianum TaxID=55505 RepID=UPI00056DC142|nr:type III pantothenate kinase [Thermonema rossianum]